MAVQLVASVTVTVCTPAHKLDGDCIVLEFVQRNEYGYVPLLILTVADPSQSPLQSTFVLAEIDAVNVQPGSFTVKLFVVVQPFASVIVTE